MDVFIHTFVSSGISVGALLQCSASWVSVSPSSVQPVCRMLRIAAGYGMTIDRTLGLTAADLAAERLLTPPTDLILNNPNHPRNIPAAAVHLDDQSTLEQRYQKEAAAVAEGSGSRSTGHDPRDPPLPNMSHLRPDLVGISSQALQLRRDMVLDSYAGVISTCALICCPPCCVHASCHFPCSFFE
jgi:hypothetical protein